ncbi:NAD-dependent protein deacetylase Sirt6 [Lepeophtheirus salmonis]|uniref:NAD-dependent protein deacetylase Sirt6 n=1 Tax=Lepeophtheirus salmonis TaxID=72036 RepID=UPI001AE688FC|nr:NAD-dependent protein deacetylase Sirt6-like [Lepeophtheirus salmonis]
MSCSYAEGLSDYANKGKLGLPESFDSPEDLKSKVKILSEWLQAAQTTVFHTGAGISTSAGIPDFRGPKGVWTLEKKGLKPSVSLDWLEAKPTKTHMAIKALVDKGKVQFVISQNIDGLHLRSGIQRHQLSELHGNMFIDKCGTCSRMFVRPTPSKTVGQKTLGDACPGRRSNGRPCRGKVHDFTLDWEDSLPDEDLDLSHSFSVLADLSIVLGSTLQIIPSGTLPTYAKKYESVRTNGGKLVIINLQPTKHDSKADLIIRGYVDDIMAQLFDELGYDVPEYDKEIDPIRMMDKSKDPNFFIDWTQSEKEAKKIIIKSDRLEDALKMKRKKDREVTAKLASKKNKSLCDDEEEKNNRGEVLNNIFILKKEETDHCNGENASSFELKNEKDL